MNDKELEKLKNMASRIIKKCEYKGYEFSDLEIAIITKITNANSIKDISWLAEQ